MSAYAYTLYLDMYYTPLPRSSQQAPTHSRGTAFPMKGMVAKEDHSRHAASTMTRTHCSSRATSIRRARECEQGGVEQGLHGASFPPSLTTIFMKVQTIAETHCGNKQ